MPFNDSLHSKKTFLTITNSNTPLSAGRFNDADMGLVPQTNGLWGSRTPLWTGSNDIYCFLTSFWCKAVIRFCVFVEFRNVHFSVLGIFNALITNCLDLNTTLKWFVLIYAGVEAVGEPVLPVRDPSPQLWVLQHHLLVIIGNDNLLTSGPAGAQRGRLLHTVA